MTFLFHPEAEDEFFAASLYYEGCEKGLGADFMIEVYSAIQNVYEVLDHLITAQDEALINPESFSRGEKLVEQAVRLLNGYIHYLQNSSRASSAVRESSPVWGEEVSLEIGCIGEGK